MNRLIAAQEWVETNRAASVSERAYSLFTTGIASSSRTYVACTPEEVKEFAEYCFKRRIFLEVSLGKVRTIDIEGYLDEQIDSGNSTCGQV